ncbi:MAG TPA: alpha/beta-type small acid-soluble spore protein [Bacillota bacterium]|mgnify:FL=1|jgi:hypothetical protein|nr:alpha/beta-type small acid-soluble spore protein [Bacillota bacterium]
MPKARKSNRTLVPQARQALDQMKYEVANELNIPTHLIEGDYWGNLSARDCGSVGGNMVRRMIEAAQASLAATTMAGVKQGFQEVIPAQNFTAQEGNLSGPSTFPTSGNLPGTSF